MTSEERHEARYQRRKAKRKKYAKEVRLEDVFTMQNMIRATRECRAGVMWKEDPIRYTTHAVVNCKRYVDGIRQGKAPHDHGIRTAKIFERGKQRELHMVSFPDRVPQKCICRNALNPGLLPGAVYDNCASQKGKGTSFCRERIVRHIQRTLYKYGPKDSYVLIVDLKKFFRSIPHRLCLETMRGAFTDDRITGLALRYIKMYHRPDVQRTEDPEERAEYIRKLKRNEAVGCTLGSEISQNMAIVVLNRLDHAAGATAEAGVRYMDDMIFFGTREQMERTYDTIARTAKDLGVKINRDKTRIQRLTEPFIFLKTRYRVTEAGRIVRRCSRESVVRERRKLKRFKARSERGLIGPGCAELSLAS